MMYGWGSGWLFMVLVWALFLAVFVISEWFANGRSPGEMEHLRQGIEDKNAHRRSIQTSMALSRAVSALKNDRRLMNLVAAIA